MAVSVCENEPQPPSCLHTKYHRLNPRDTRFQVILFIRVDLDDLAPHHGVRSLQVYLGYTSAISLIGDWWFFFGLLFRFEHFDAENVFVDMRNGELHVHRCDLFGFAHPRRSIVTHMRTRLTIMQDVKNSHVSAGPNTGPQKINAI